MFQKVSDTIQIATDFLSFELTPRGARHVIIRLSTHVIRIVRLLCLTGIMPSDA